MKRIGIGGMVANKPFIDCILVLDTRNRKFGVVSRGNGNESREGGVVFLVFETAIEAFHRVPFLLRFPDVRL